MATSDSTTPAPALTDAHDYFTNRKQTLQRLAADGGLVIYPHKFHVDEEIAAFRIKYGHLTPGQTLDGSAADTEGVMVRVAGRITGVRSSSSKLYFYDIVANGASLQIMANMRTFAGTADAFAAITATVLRRGDIVGVEGMPSRSKTGELSVVALSIVLLSPCYHALPDQDTLVDSETRYRNRHLDMIVNTKVTNNFRMRARVIKFIRNFFDARGYVEVETPVMNVIPGGASARPFVTHHNALNTNMFLRVAPELFLKQCVVGGLSRVYEVGKNFRNEGVDQTHNPEFTAIETYCAFDDYNDVMKTTEDLLSSMVLELTGSYVIQYPLKNGEVRAIDFAPPFARFPMIKTLEQRMGVTFPGDLSSAETVTFLKELLTARGIVCEEPRTTPRMLDKLVGDFIEPDLINPGFLTDHPQIMSPLAKWHRDDPTLTERFELFVAGRELCNAYTELNDPFKQRETFQSEKKGRDAGDDESQPVDEAFCRSLEYGLPPTAGWGMGIDRLCMLLTGEAVIREVIIFPTMKPLEEEKAAQAQMSGVIKSAGEKIVAATARPSLVVQ